MDQLPTIQKMKRPTITLAMIVKNEEKNLPRLFKSIEGCFDEVVIVDTGSTDKTVEIAFENNAKIFHFQWVDSFSKARNFAFSQATSDYICWLDGDDVLRNKENFIHWRDHAMGYIDLWFNTYNYAINFNKKTEICPNGEPVIAFVRERVMKRSLNPIWQYDLHEGIIPREEWSKNYATTWCVDHLRDADDTKADRSRNIKLLEKSIKNGASLDGRMQFYYGKELFEASRPDDAIVELDKALKMDIEHHDRLLALQYGAYAAMHAFDQVKDEYQERKMSLFNKAVEFASEGVKLDPNRAEFHVILGDASMRIGRLDRSVPYFAAAKACLKNFNTSHADPIYSFKDLYGEAPSVHLAKIYTHLGLLEKAKKEALECVETYNNEEAKNIIAEIDRISDLTRVDGPKEPTEDIVFTCPPQTAYEFDEELYKTKGMGGSETALIEMAKHLKLKTGRPVKVFNMRKDPLLSESGVEYLPASQLNAYMSKKLPFRHIAWRHNIKVTNAPTYLWCHDLFTPTVEQAQNFDKFLALSEFHKNYTMGLQGVGEDKIIVTRNGLSPDKFKFDRKPKDPNKVVWMSSPDRGLERAILVMEKARLKIPTLELHVYYGIEGLYKYGPQMSALADKLKQMMSERFWIKYHGFTEQKKMYEEVSDAVVWCHPNNFIETYAITAIECLANRIYPVVRRLGALADTLGEAERLSQATLLDYEWGDMSSIDLHANAVVQAIETKAWERIDFDPNKLSWESLAGEWMGFMGINKRQEVSAS